MRLKKISLPAIGFLYFIFWISAACPCAAQDGPGVKLSALEKGILAEMNLARTDPEKYNAFLKELRGKYRGSALYIRRKIMVKTQEGIAAVEEAIEYLGSQKPVGLLKLSRGMTWGARDHVKAQGPSGETGHASPDGSDPAERVSRYGKWSGMLGENIYYGHGMGARQIVMGFIIDDGVPDRGHRDTLFNPKFRIAGVACGPHSFYKTMCVITYAAGYREKGARQPD